MKTNNKSMNEKIDYKKFISETGADTMIDDLLQYLIKQNNGSMPVWSDLIKEENGKEYQYVNYVQEGGGVLGVGLIGYTYVLEKMGVRFLKLAGTSAGAINTMLLASVDKENYKNTGHKFDYKSEIILQEMLDFSLWKMVDGSKFGKWLIRLFVNSKAGLKALISTLLFAFLVPILFSILSVFGRVIFGVRPSGSIMHLYDVFVIVAFIALIILLIVVVIIIYYLYRFRKASFGINPGDAFHEWIIDILKRNNIHTAAGLETKMQNEISLVELRPERKIQNLPGDSDIIQPPYMTLVTSDITNEVKVEFPAMAADYWEEPDQVNPADFVRASMSIPIFFEPFRVNVSAEVKRRSAFQQKHETIRRMHKETYPASFVDGGILSNFPFNVFHNPKIKIARMPTFGVRLEDEDHIIGNAAPGNGKRKLIPFLGRIFNTVRFNYDRDFLKKNSVYETCIAHVDVAGFNWLNFGIDYETQKKLFIKGVEAAITFFKGGNVWIDGKETEFAPYDWKTFKEERAKIVS